jgi:hypothetical protein
VGSVDSDGKSVFAPLVPVDKSAVDLSNSGLDSEAEMYFGKFDVQMCFAGAAVARRAACVVAL